MFPQSFLLVLASLFSAVQAQDGIVRGVNLGGWLVCEEWMTPSLFNATVIKDEWHLCAALGKQKCQQQLQDHWENFYTRDDLQQIKDAGLTAVRIPLGYWAVDLEDYEPYVSGQYPYLVRAVEWAMELGLKVFIDLHGAPGSQNGWEETGLIGAIGFPDNSSNSDRTLKVLQNLTMEFSKDIYAGTVTNIEPLNEPIFDLQKLKTFYTSAAGVMGQASASGINFTIHDAFFNPHSWTNYDPFHNASQSPAKYLTVDTHQFWAFPPLDILDEAAILQRICDFGKQLRVQQAGNEVPPTLVGEWSLSTGLTAHSTSNTESDQDKRTLFRKLFEAQNAAYTPHAENEASIGWLFWAWKTEYDIDAWSYRRGLADEYIPKNVSDPSTYVFPIRSNDSCIDTTHPYQAPASVAGLSNKSPSTASSGASGATATATKKSAGSGSNGSQSATSWFLGFMALMYIIA